MKTLALLIALSMTGCASHPTTYEAAIGANISSHMPWTESGDGGFAGGTEVVRFSARNEMTKNTFVEYSHTSHLHRGWPVDSRSEDSLDAVWVGVRFGGKQ
jgi:hypothetical protein